tara:strand:- start:370 stop:498 length:129 start_codon:yes stop_codon:yes gene_type:complete
MKKIFIKFKEVKMVISDPDLPWDMAIKSIAAILFPYNTRSKK